MEELQRPKKLHSVFWQREKTGGGEPPNPKLVTND